LTRPTSRGLLAACASLLASAALAAPAQATIGVSSFSITPSTLQAGGSTGQPGPNLVVDAQFSTSDADTPKDALLSLAPGLLANPNIPTCSTAQFQANSCPDSSHIATGYVIGTAPQYGLTLNFPTEGYLVQSTGSEIARFGIITSFFDYPVATLSGPVVIRKTPTFGIDIPIDGLPNQVDGTQVIVNGLHLTINGQMGGVPFTRNPTSCASAVSSISVDSYGSATPVSQQSAFTPTGCSSLAYAPTLAGTAAEDSADDGVAVTATISQKYGEADNSQVNLILPHSLSPRLSVLSSACSNADVTTCTGSSIIGTATITTPLLANPLTAKIVLVAHSGSIPTLAILIPAPISYELDATPVLTGTSVQALVANIPDIPLSGLSLNLPGGASSLFRAGTHFCTTAQTFSGSFTAWSGATASPSGPATISGCPATSAAAINSAPQDVSLSAPSMPRAAGGTSARSGSGTAGTTGSASVTGLAADHPRLTLAVGSARQAGGLRSLGFRIPSGFSVRTGELSRYLRVRLDGRLVRATWRYARGVLTITFARAGRMAFVTLVSPALTASRTSVTSARSHHAGRVTLQLTVKNTTGRSTTLSLHSTAR
jgi:hypothetical protein